MVPRHAHEGRQSCGEAEQRIYALSAWRETPFYTPMERAALGWTEAVTLVAAKGVSDDVFEEARKHFTEKELVDLTMAVVAINGWNRLNVAFRTVPGDYEPTLTSKADRRSKQNSSPRRPKNLRA